MSLIYPGEEYEPNYQQDTPVCACRNVKYDPRILQGGLMQDRWVCTCCGREFTKVFQGGATTYSICDHSGSMIPMPPDVSALRWVCKKCGMVSKDGNNWEHQTIDDLPGGSVPSQNDQPKEQVGFDTFATMAEMEARAKVLSELLHQPGGSTPSQYALPPEAKELQDLIEYREMNFAMGNIFKACYRKKDVGDPLYDIRKIIWFAKREEARLMKEVDHG